MSLTRRALLARSLIAVPLGAGLSTLVTACAPAAPTINTAAPTAGPAVANKPAPTSAAIAATAPAATATTAPAAAGGSLTIAVPSLPDSLDTQASIRPQDAWLFAAFADTLTTLDSQQNLAGQLAESWTQPQPTVWQFKLRPGVTFHNGESLDAAAVKFTVDRVADPSNKLARASQFATIASTSVVDSLTVAITTKDVDVILPRRLMTLYIQPLQYIQSVGAAGFATKPVGSGPFEVGSFTVHDRATLTRARTSWRTAKLDQIEFREVPDASTRVNAIRAGDIHIATNLDPTAARQLQSEGIIVDAGEVAQMTSIFIRSALGPPYNNKLFRQAVDAALDKESIVSAVSAGYGHASPGQLVTQGTVGFNPALQMTPYDPARARDLLGQAGYPNGVDAKLEVAVAGSPSPVNKDIAQAAVQALGDVGINVDLHTIDYAPYLQDFSSGNLDGMYISALGTSPSLDADVALQFFLSSAPQKIYNNPDFDALLMNSRKELDPDKRAGLLQQAITLLHDDTALVPLYNVTVPSARSARVQGFRAFLNQTWDVDGLAING
jgi:peptide/nickel transport system substrate-binding protein